MASLAVRRPRCLLDVNLTGTSRNGPLLLQLAQTRGYAAPRAQSKAASKAAPRKISSQFKSNKNGEVKERKFDGDFNRRVINPMPINQLSHPLFKSDQRIEMRVPMFRPEALTEAAVGTVMQFPLSQDDTIKAYGVPTNVLMDFRVLSKPCSVIRDVTLSLIDTLDTANQKSSKDTRLVLTGSAGCGKSFLMLQAVEYCSASNWITLYVPRGITTVDSSSHYVYDPQTRTYLQPEYSYQLLRRFLSVNSRQLAELSTRKGFSVDDLSVPAESPLTDLIQVGLDDERLAPAILSRVLEEVSQQNTFPVLMAVDDIQAVYRTSLYRDPHYRPILSQYLSVPRLILEYACGSKFFTRGAFLGAVSTANTRFKMPIELSEALGLPLPRPAGPYYHRSSELEHYAGGLRNFPVPEQLNVGEAASLFEVWMADKALHSGEVRTLDNEQVYKPTDELFMSKFCEASGNPRSFVWNGLMATMNSL